MAFYFSRRRLRPAEVEEGGELNIVPYLDVLMNLIIFMLLSMTGLAAFGVLEVNAPKYGASAEAAAPAEQLQLSVLISKRGFFIEGADAILGLAPVVVPAVAKLGDAPAAPPEPTVPLKADGTHDFEALVALLVKVKAVHPSETRVIIGADADIPYETLIHTMDALREHPKDKTRFFPDVTLGSF